MSNANELVFFFLLFFYFFCEVMPYDGLLNRNKQHQMTNTRCCVWL